MSAEVFASKYLTNFGTTPRAALDAKVKASQKHNAEALEFHSRQASRPARASVGMAGAKTALAKTALLLAPRGRAETPERRVTYNSNCGGHRKVSEHE